MSWECHGSAKRKRNDRGWERVAAVVVGNQSRNASAVKQLNKSTIWFVRFSVWIVKVGFKSRMAAGEAAVTR